jgi:hypothetical protein
LQIEFYAECPTLADFAWVGIFRFATPTYPVDVESKPPPFVNYGRWGTRWLF